VLGVDTVDGDLRATDEDDVLASSGCFLGTHGSTPNSDLDIQVHATHSLQLVLGNN